MDAVSGLGVTPLSTTVGNVARTTAKARERRPHYGGPRAAATMVATKACLSP